MCAARGVAPGTARQGGDLNKFLWTLAAGLAFASSIVAAQSGGPADRQTHPAAGSDHFMDAAFAERARNLNLKSSSALVVYQGTGRVLYAKNTETVVPIASITKLMTAMVTLDAKLSLDESVQIILTKLRIISDYLDYLTKDKPIAVSVQIGIQGPKRGHPAGPPLQ